MQSIHSTIGNSQEGLGRNQYVAVYVREQLFAMPAKHIEDILLTQQITPLPLAPPEILGVLNLRGRIVTAIDLRVKMGMPPIDLTKAHRIVVVEDRRELYSFAVDAVWEILDIPLAD